MTATVIVTASCSSNEVSRFIDDRAAVLSGAQRSRIQELNQALLDTFAIDCSVIILGEPTDDINGLAASLFEERGRMTKSSRGLLFLIDPHGRQVRIEVGYGLEAIFPDGFISYLEREQMAPFFEQRRVGAGIEATEELLIARAHRDADGLSFDPQRDLGIGDHYSGGGGAQHDVAIGAAMADKLPVSDDSAYRPGTTPEASLAAYQRVLQNHVKDPNLALYTPRTRTFFASWVVTNAQQDNELQKLLDARIDRVIISGNRAVITFPPDNRHLPPYFLELGGEGWSFDFAAMNDVIRMNHRNQWHFTRLDHDYMFGFPGWQFDSNGFPRRPQ